VDTLVVVTQTPDTWSLGTAFAIHHLLELDKHCFVVDVNISAFTSTLPSGIADAQFFAQLYGEKEVARVMRGMGIRSVRCADGLTTTDLMYAAAKHLPIDVPIDKGVIDGMDLRKFCAHL